MSEPHKEFAMARLPDGTGVLLLRRRASAVSDYGLYWLLFVHAIAWLEAAGVMLDIALSFPAFAAAAIMGSFLIASVTGAARVWRWAHTPPREDFECEAVGLDVSGESLAAMIEAPLDESLDFLRKRTIH